MDGRMNRCVTWHSCDFRTTYNDGTPMVYEREIWRSPMAGSGMSDEEIREVISIIG